MARSLIRSFFKAPTFDPPLFLAVLAVPVLFVVFVGLFSWAAATEADSETVVGLSLFGLAVVFSLGPWLMGGFVALWMKTFLVVSALASGVLLFIQALVGAMSWLNATSTSMALFLSAWTLQLKPDNAVDLPDHAVSVVRP